MNDPREDQAPGKEAATVPRFCPRCQLASEGDEALCDDCGEALVPQGYCPICEEFWALSVGMPCPKHEIELEEGQPDAVHDDPDEAAPKWITVGTFADSMAAEAPRIRLEAEGIPTFLDGERMGMNSIYQVATGGVKLQVPERFLADARVLLSQSWSKPPVHDDLDDAWEDLAPEPGATRRKVMKGLIVLFLVGPFLVALLALLLGT